VSVSGWPALFALIRVIRVKPFCPQLATASPFPFAYFAVKSSLISSVVTFKVQGFRRRARFTPPWFSPGIGFFPAAWCSAFYFIRDVCELTGLTNSATSFV